MDAIERLADVAVGDLATWLAGLPPEAFARLADPAWGNAAERCRPIAEALVAEHFPGCCVSGVGLFVLAPGQMHPAHRDEQPPEWRTRVHIPVLTNPDAVAIVDSGTLHLEVGVAYTFDTRQTHAVANRGTTPRVHLVFDVYRNPER